MNPTLFINSMAVGMVATVMSTAVGIAAAMSAVMHPRWRRVILSGGALCLALPPFLPANAWLEFTAGPRASGAPEWVAIWTLPIVALVLATALWPITLFLVLAGWSRLQSGPMEAAADGRGWTALRRVLLPAVSGELRVAVVVTLALSLANFTVPTLFQVRVFTEEFWIRFNTQFDLPGALAGSWPLLLLPPLLLVWIRRQTVSWNQQGAPLDPMPFRSMLGAGLRKGATLLTAAWLALALVLPLGQLVSSPRTWSELSGALAAGGMAVGQSLRVALLSATAIAVLGLVMSRRLARRSGGIRGVLVLGWILFLLPGVFEGVGLLHLFNAHWLSPLTQGAGILVVAVGLRYFAPAWTLLAEARRTLDSDQSDAARLTGAGAWRVFRTVEWPQLQWPVAAAWYAVFLLALWDVETVVLIQPPGGETLALRIFNLLHYGHGTQVNALCVVLLGMALLPAVVLWLARSVGWMRRAGLPLLLAGFALVSGCSNHEPTAGAGTGGEGALVVTPVVPIDSKLFRAVQVIGSRGVAPGQFNKPRSLVCDRQDNLYVADMTGRIQKFDPQGHWLLQWQMPQTDLGKPKGMSLDVAGNVIVVEPHYQRVNHFSTDGKLVRQWGHKGTAPGELILPRSLVAAPDGRFFLTEYTVVDRVQRFAADGTFEKTWGAPGVEPGRFNRAEGIGLDVAGRLYVADSCNHRIQIFTQDGAWLRAYGSAGSEPGKLSYPYDVRVDAVGRQFVCEFGNSRLSIFDDKDQLIEVVGRAGGGVAEFANPWAIAFDSHGNLFVADSQNHRVQKLFAREPSGGRRVASAATGPGGNGL